MANVNQKDWFGTFTITIPASGRQDINKYGRYIILLTNSNTNFDPIFSVDKQQGGKLPAGIGLELPFEHFSSITFQNPDPVNPMTIEIALSNGAIVDNRSVISGTINVADGGGSVTVDNVNFTSINQGLWVENTLNRETDMPAHLKVASKTNLRNSSYASAMNSTAVILTAVGNINGVIIRTLSGFKRSSTNYATLFINGNPITSLWSNGGDQSFELKDLFIESGALVELVSAGTTAQVNCFYEVM